MYEDDFEGMSTEFKRAYKSKLIDDKLPLTRIRSSVSLIQTKKKLKGVSVVFIVDIISLTLCGLSNPQWYFHVAEPGARIYTQSTLLKGGSSNKSLSSSKQSDFYPLERIHQLENVVHEQKQKIEELSDENKVLNTVTYLSSPVTNPGWY
jgi:hypothetical protein